MNLPILIVGYERSGTTMLRRLISMHPGLEYDLVHEKSKLLLQAKNTEDAIKTMTINNVSIKSGLKVPYVRFHDVREIINKFLKLFPNGYLMHIIRNPLETINSQVRKFNRNFRRCVRNYYMSVPQVYDYTKSLPHSCQISYENLVTEPYKVLSKLYTWMGQSVSADHIKRVINTKDPWECNGRSLPGLRYFDTIIPKERTIILKPAQVQVIKTKKPLQLLTDF